MKEYVALLKRIEINHEWENYRAGLICSVIANVNRDSRKHPQAYTPDDFMPKKKITMTADQMLSNIKALNIAYGGKEV